MVDQAEREDDAELEIETGEGLEPGEGTESGAAEGDPPEGDEPEDEIEVTFADEAAPASNEERDTGLVRKLRAEIRDRDARLAAHAKGEPAKPVAVGDKPTLEACDYDEARYDSEVEAWKTRKAEADEADAQAQKRTQDTQKAWAAELEDFGRKKTALKVRDFEAAEEEVVAGLTQVQQAIVIKAADDSAKVIYALGKHPAKLATLAAIEDPIKFAVAVSKLEGTLKVTQRRKAPEPEGTVRGSAPLSPQADKHLERLEKEADANGDRTKVIAYKRKLRTQGRS